MKAAFDRLLQYNVRVTCVSPLHTGSTDAGELLRSDDGTYFMQGTSLAGALRSWDDDPVLFGTNDCGGELTISDLIFEDCEPIFRTRVRIDGASGTAADGGLFRTAALPTGTVGSFTLIWKGTRDTAAVRQQLERDLAALHSGSIRLGGQKSNGFGRVTLQVCVLEYDMTQPRELAAWLDGTSVPRPVVLPDAVDEQHLTFRVEAETEELLIRAAASEGSGREAIHMVPYQENGRYVLPASSIKGVIRSQMTRIAAAAGREELVDRWCGCAGDQDSGRAGMLYFDDGTFEGTEQVRTRIRINRFTGGVMNGAMIKSKTLCGTVRWEITLPRQEKAACALLLFALRDLGLGVSSLGGLSAIGAGRFERMKITAGSVTLNMEAGAASLHDPDGLAAAWLKSWEEETK